ncbi:putative btb poz domain protein [Botrytis fragariae]|uniref:Putative btb poz domain protein n=1 Tax=Botrytis fragariae TaxID=1964551 RepID=A0A8H6EG55_9HELO|nr:putative btb poz domain protein [Botrytis fragariae]KAF5870916.1 putative btb poz domain protein [Botrytis fragariae]
MTSKTSGALEDMAYKQSNKHEPPDFTIKCKGHSFLVHKDVFAPQSKPLGAAMDTEKFLEGTKREMILSDENDDPEIVALMVQFLYSGEYTISFPSNTSSSARSSSDEAIRCIRHVALHIFSDLWYIPSLQVFTLLNLQTTLSHLPLSYFASVLRYIYEETPGSYTRVRQVAVKALMERFTVGEIMKVKELRELLSADGECAVDLLVWGEERRVKRERRVGRDWEQSAVRGRRVCEESMGMKGDILGETTGWADNTGARF